MRVTGVGFSCMDVYDQLHRMYPTGNSVDFAIHLRRMGVQTSLVSVVGTDEYGAMMIDTLKQEKVDVTHLDVRPGSTAVFKMELNGNDRVHKEKIEGVMAHFALTEADRRFITEHDMLHTNLSGRVERELSYFRDCGVSIVFDFSTRTKRDIAGPILPDVDYAFFSYTQEDAYITEFLAWAQALGPRVVIATLGEQGSLAYDGKTLYRGQIIPADVVNTVGAGDSFCAGFMYGVLQGWTIPESLTQGARTASGVVSKFEPY
ncbi:fructoselysine 6-kinase [Paenibacillus sp. 1P07SE]|uniref:fructoselysine 6-kinase n=1 Tax=Paenibacillus sp. 1P07SE TaxID=3132209 RepID=UPI0039A4AB7D